ncbi:hypothetical protein SLS60_007128 [Paraconiothyrium brasiliense]|uniref:Uncharacterized protein n=1 Tax=Paraconiothyrium brasiliense TaxID=300254 RepID=A0ABR3R8I0_9PLEO
MGRMIIKDLDAGRSPQCFRSLRSLHMDLWDWEYFPPSAVVPFMHLTQLKQLILKGWGFQTKRAKRRGLSVFKSGRNWPIRSSAVEDLKLDPVYSSAFQVSESLFDHATTLKSVYMGDSDYYNDPLPEPFKDTTSWTSLKMLQIPYSLLVGNKPRRKITYYLPPSLDNLVLYSTHKALARMETDIDSFVAEMSDEIYEGYIEGTLPCLKGVELSLDWSFTADQTIEHKVPRPDVRHIVSAFQDHGVTFGVSMHSSYQSGKAAASVDKQH